MVVHHTVVMHRTVVAVVHGLGLGRGAETNNGNEPEQGNGNEFFDHRNLGLLDREKVVPTV